MVSFFLFVCDLKTLAYISRVSAPQYKFKHSNNTQHLNVPVSLQKK